MSRATILPSNAPPPFVQVSAFTPGYSPCFDPPQSPLPGGECVRPAAGICSRCDRLHVDRDVDGELLANCLPCAEELIGVGAEMLLERGASGKD